MWAFFRWKGGAGTLPDFCRTACARAAAVVLFLDSCKAVLRSLLAKGKPPKYTWIFDSVPGLAFYSKKSGGRKEPEGAQASPCSLWQGDLPKPLKRRSGGCRVPQGCSEVRTNPNSH